MEELYSDCCEAEPIGIIEDDLTGICSKCGELSDFHYENVSDFDWAEE